MKRSIKCDIREIAVIFIPVGSANTAASPKKFLVALLPILGISLGDCRATSCGTISLGRLFFKSPQPKENEPVREVDCRTFASSICADGGPWKGSVEICSLTSGESLIQLGNWHFGRCLASSSSESLSHHSAASDCDKFFPNMFFGYFRPLARAISAVSLELGCDLASGQEMPSITLKEVLMQNFTQHLAFEIKLILPHEITGGELPPLEEAA